jgi:hypothetical protein
VTALEIRPEEIGQFDLAAYRERRARMTRHVVHEAPPEKVQTPIKPAPTLIVAVPYGTRAKPHGRATHRLDAHCYIAPIGPTHRRDVLVVSSQPFLKHIPIKKIQAVVASTYGLRVNDLLSHRRTQTVVRPRQEAMWLTKIHTTHSLPEIGRRFGGRDHTTVLHAVRKIEDLIRHHAYMPLAAPQVERLARQYEEFSSLAAE